MSLIYSIILMDNIYVLICSFVLNIFLFVLYIYKILKINRNNDLYLVLLCNSFLVSLFSLCSLYIEYTDISNILYDFFNKISYLAVFNFSLSFMVYLFNLKDYKIKNFMYYYLCLNIIVLLMLFIGRTSNTIIDISTIICVVASIIMVGIGCFSFIKCDKKIEVSLVLLLSILLEIGLVMNLINNNFIYLEFIISLCTLVIFSTLEKSELKLIEELDNAKKRSEKSNQAKTDFLSSMSHEIRTPLNAIVGLNECIIEAETLDDAKENAKDVISAAGTLLEIVNGILDISKIESGKLELVNVKYRPRVLFDEIVRMLEPRIRDKNLDLNVVISDNLPYRLRGDQANFKKCIINIFTNAAKYTDEGSISFIVDCKNDNNRCDLIVSVEDTGRGIKKEYIDKIFSKFERLEEDRNSAIEGTGLGLAITKQIVELMGGKVLVQSVYGEGSKFSICISQEIVNLKQSEESKNRKVIPENTSLDFTNKNVLVVDDNNLNIKVASKLLAKYNINIDTALSGKECIEKVKNKQYDLILMDIMMPNMDGTQTFKRIKQNKSFDTPVIALTANALVGMRETYIKEGFSEYLSKPINRDELEKILKHFLGNNKKKPINFDDTETLILDFSSLKN